MWYFKAFSKEEAKNIKNYTVYGLDGLRKVAAVAPISQMDRFLTQDIKRKKLKIQEYLTWTAS